MNALSYSLSSLLLGLSLCAGQASAQSLVEYDPIGMQGSNQLDSTFVANGMTANPAFQVGFGGWGNTNVWPVGQLGMASPTLDPLQYIQFDVTSTMSVEYTGLRYSRLSYQGDGNRAAAVADEPRCVHGGRRHDHRPRPRPVTSRSTSTSAACPPPPG